MHHPAHRFHRRVELLHTFFLSTAEHQAGGRVGMGEVGFEWPCSWSFGHASICWTISRRLVPNMGRALNRPNTSGAGMLFRQEPLAIELPGL